MMTLISLAITVAFAYSLAVTLGWEGDPLWWELATLVTIMLLGHWIEMRSIGQARGALKELAKLLPDMAVRVTDGDTEDVPVSELRDGDVVLVRPGASVPADGVVKQGRSAVNESMLTGESKPVDKEPGSEVVAGTVNGSGSLRVEVTGTGEKTALAGIMRLAPALVTADVGVAIGAGTDVAVEAGDIVLVRSDPRDLPRIIRLSRATYRKMLQNLRWAAGYNVFAIPLAAGVLASLGVLLAPAFAAVLMSLSTGIVAVNAQLLRRVDLGGG
jgi:cation transport ATPase